MWSPKSDPGGLHYCCGGHTLFEGGAYFFGGGVLPLNCRSPWSDYQRRGGMNGKGVVFILFGVKC